MYPPVNKHSNGKSPSWIGNTSSNGGFSIAMLDYRSVGLMCSKSRKKKNSQRQGSNTGRNAIMHLASDIPCVRKIPICNKMFQLPVAESPPRFSVVHPIPKLASHQFDPIGFITGHYCITIWDETLPLTQQHIFHIIVPPVPFNIIWDFFRSKRMTCLDRLRHIHDVSQVQEKTLLSRWSHPIRKSTCQPITLLIPFEETDTKTVYWKYFIFVELFYGGTLLCLPGLPLKCPLLPQDLLFESVLLLCTVQVQ